jgi:hypothetical protein
MFEHHHKPLLPPAAFARRVAAYAAVSLGLVVFSLAVGIVGYRTFEGMPYVDAFLNAAMLMGGMGPVGELHTKAGKIFAGCYALYCGLMVIVAVGLLAAPIAHRFLHRFHLEFESADSPKASPKKK